MKIWTYIKTILGFANTPKPDYCYRDLAPIDNISEDNTYLEALEWAIKNNRIKNIALSGSYGSGKSSVIQSYQNKYLKPKLNIFKPKYINISLASFLTNSLENKQVIGFTVFICHFSLY